jgi:hypothetical protein
MGLCMAYSYSRSLLFVIPHRFPSIQIENTIIEAFASLRYHSPKNVYCTLQRPVLLLEVSTQQGMNCIWTCLHYRGMCCTGKCLHYRGLSCCICHGRVYDTEACAAPGCVTSQWLELHLDLSSQQRPVMHLDVSTPRVLSCT